MANLKTKMPWRPNVGMIIINSFGCAWMGRRAGLWDYPWQFPQGGIDEGESSEQAMWRELKEEAGIEKASILHVHPEKLQYQFPAHVAQELGYQGQQQTWFLLSYRKDDQTIQINQEFCQWAWVPWSNLPDVIQTMVAPFKRTVYTTLVEGPFQSKIVQTKDSF